MRERKYILAQYDISGIQDYIFATNRLRENVGASYNVNRILNLFLPDAINEAVKTEGGFALINWNTEKSEFQFESNQEILAEVLYIGGGNAVVIYKNRRLYDKSSHIFAIKVAENCHGITVLSAFVETGLEDYCKEIEELEMELSNLKRMVPRNVPMSSWPIVEQDSVYGLPITKLYDKDNMDRVMSVIQYEKYEASRLKGMERENPYVFALQMEQLIDKRGEDSHVAVVHIDGNGMGELFDRIKREHRDYRSAIPAMRLLSKTIANVYEDSFYRMVSAIETISGKNPLPIRCLIMDGDDLTFICGARFALPAVVFFMRQLMELADSTLSVTACAGIAFVRSHFPFRIAYQIAEECCANAKKDWYKDRCHNGKAGYLDYHIVQGAYTQEMEKQRDRKSIRVRPFRVAEETDISRFESIDFLNSIQKLLVQEKAGVRIWPRNRLEKLYKAYLRGQQEIRLLGEEFLSRGYDLSKLVPGYDKDFDYDTSYGIFDALEIMDFYDEDLYNGFFQRYGLGGNK